MIAVNLDHTSEIPVDLQYAAVGLNPVVGTARTRAGTDFDADSGRAGRALGETDGQAVTGDSGCGADAGSTARQGNRSAREKNGPGGRHSRIDEADRRIAGTPRAGERTALKRNSQIVGEKPERRRAVGDDASGGPDHHVALALDHLVVGFADDQLAGGGAARRAALERDDGDVDQLLHAAAVVVDSIPRHALIAEVGVVENDLARILVVAVTDHGVAGRADQHRPPGIDLAHVVLEGEAAAAAVHVEGAGPVAVERVTAGFDIEVDAVDGGGEAQVELPGVAVPFESRRLIPGKNVVERHIQIEGRAGIGIAAPVLAGAEVVRQAVPERNIDLGDPAVHAAADEGVRQFLLRRGFAAVALVEALDIVARGDQPAEHGIEFVHIVDIAVAAARMDVDVAFDDVRIVGVIVSVQVVIAEQHGQRGRRTAVHVLDLRHEAGQQHVAGRGAGDGVGRNGERRLRPGRRQNVVTGRGRSGRNHRLADRNQVRAFRRIEVFHSNRQPRRPYAGTPDIPVSGGTGKEAVCGGDIRSRSEPR